MAASTKKTVIASNIEPMQESEEKKEMEPKMNESIYTAAELANAHKTFGTSFAIVAAALKTAGKEQATISEAKDIIEKFKNQEVK